MKTPAHTHIILVRYLGPTNTLGSRIRLTLPQLGKSRTLPYDYRFSTAEDGALAWLSVTAGIEPVSSASVSRGLAALILSPEDITAAFNLFQRP